MDEEGSIEGRKCDNITEGRKYDNITETGITSMCAVDFQSTGIQKAEESKENILPKIL